MFPYDCVTEPFVRLRRLGRTAPQPLATAVPRTDLPLNGRFAFVDGTAAPPFAIFLTLASFVLETTVLPRAPSLFFFLAVEAR